jgi:serine/threonine-protein kinase
LGAVYAALDEKLQRGVAIKILHRHTGEALRRRVLEEARKTARLSDPAIVTVYSVLDETDPPAIVMERVEGFPLDQFSANLTVHQKVRLLREVARGLATAHAQDLVHRDLKPENILVGPGLRPRILDFGLSISTREAPAKAGLFEGTPLYASPEQARAGELTTASDVFSFGSVMFKVLTNRTPFEAQNLPELLQSVATTKPPFPREVATGVPEDLQAICLACLASDPKDRPAAADVALELGRFLIGEPVRLRPKLYDDLLRQNISRHQDQAREWESQSIISREEHDALEIVHRRLLADEDHWIIDARRITLLQTGLSVATWLTVVATVLTVWMLRPDLSATWRWLLPTCFTGALAIAGYIAHRDGDKLAAATFLAGTSLAAAPCLLSWVGAVGLFSRVPPTITQLFPDAFSNQQVLAASLTALAVSGTCLWRLRMTGFAWTTSALGVAVYLSFLMIFNWLDQKTEIQALWCLPLILLEPFALWLERLGRVRWTLPFHLVAILALISCLDLIAGNGPTLRMLGLAPATSSYFNHDRLVAFSFAMNGVLFLALMLAAERSSSLDLRRASKLMEVLAIVHVLSALFVNALNHRSDPLVRIDVWVYLTLAAGFMIIAPFRSRWRLLVGGLAGIGLGSYLLVDLGIVARKPFIIGLGFAGVLIALGTFIYVQRNARAGRSPGRS